MLVREELKGNKRLDNKYIVREEERVAYENIKVLL